MPRNLDPEMYAALGNSHIDHLRLVQLQFRSEWLYLSTGSGPVTWNGQTYRGVGDLGTIGEIVEAIEVSADGTTVALSGIQQDDLAEAMNDVMAGGVARIYMALLDGNPFGPEIVGTPWLMFDGKVGQPSVNVQGETIGISITLETGMVYLQRPSGRKYTAADQALDYPDDTAFDWVPALNDLALRWGS